MPGPINVGGVPILGQPKGQQVQIQLVPIQVMGPQGPVTIPATQAEALIMQGLQHHEQLLARIIQQLGKIMTSQEVTQTSINAEGTAISALQAGYDTYIAALTKAFNDVVAAWQAAQQNNGLSSTTLDQAITTAQADIAALAPVTDPTVAPAPAPTPTPDPSGN